MITPKRKKTKQIKIGNIKIGADNPIMVQSMTSTKTTDVTATLSQINELINLNCEAVRIAVPDINALNGFKEIRKLVPGIPLIADIHFNAELAIKSIIVGADKIRVNPGNLGSIEKFKKVLDVALKNKKAVRIGVNSGSLEKDILRKWKKPCAEAMVESALTYVKICNKMNFNNVVISIKGTNVFETVKANRMLSEKTDFPLHLGITEAGSVSYGTVKSAVGIGALLVDGIGDTIRVSLTGNPVNEIGVAYNILKAAGARNCGPEIISCPTCGRIQYDMPKIVDKVEKRILNIHKPLKIAIMGCIVNGPGEAKDADIGLAGGKNEAVLFKKGKKIKKVKEQDMVDELFKLIDEM